MASQSVQSTDVAPRVAQWLPVLVGTKDTMLPMLERLAGAGESFEHGEHGVFRAYQDGKPLGDAGGHVGALNGLGCHRRLRIRTGSRTESRRHCPTISRLSTASCSRSPKANARRWPICCNASTTTTLTRWPQTGTTFATRCDA